MTKQESGTGGLLSRMAKFVRHPTVDWSDLDQRTQGLDAEREALEAAIQRKRRNDKVRHRELNELRQVMLARLQPVAASTIGSAAAEVQPSVLPSAFQPHLPDAADAAKSRTIEQIARIEQQMSQNWVRRRQDADAEGLRIGGGATVSARLDGGVTQPAHLGARLASEGSAGISIDVMVGEPNDAVDAALAHPAIAEAAVRFANGEAEAAERGLRSLLVQEPQSLTARMAGLALLDLLHACRQFEAFEEFAAEYAERFGVPVPRWPTDVGVSTDRATVTAPGAEHLPLSAWACPLFLDTAAVQGLAHTMASPGGVKWLDWTGLLSADVHAAQALLTEVQRWLQQPVDLRFLGSAVLRRRLKASTPSGRQENERVWWQLRLALLQAMHRRDEFDLVALDYCVTYGVLPPEWVAPACRFEPADSMPAAGALPELQEPIQPLASQMIGLDVLEWPSMVTTLQGSETQFPPAQSTLSTDWPTTLPAVSGAALRLCGHLSGDMEASISALDAALGVHAPDKIFVIDCQLLDRVDFTAAGTLLQWLMAAMARGVHTELRGVSRLVAAFFHVVGIDEAVTVRLRQY